MISKQNTQTSQLLPFCHDHEDPHSQYIHAFILSFAFPPTPPLVSSTKASQNLPQERGGGVQHLRVPALPRALLPRHLPLGDGQLHEELPLPVLRGLVRAGPHRGGPAPERGRVPLHGHRGWREDGGHLLPPGVQRGAPGRLAGLHAGLLPAAGRVRPLAAVTLAHANANPCLCLHRGLHGDRRNKKRAWPTSDVQVRFAEHGGTKRVGDALLEEPFSPVLILLIFFFFRFLGKNV